MDVNQDKKQYGYGQSEDDLFHGPCDTSEEAVHEGFGLYADAAMIYICEVEHVNVRNFVDAYRIFDDIVEQASDDVGDACEGWLVGVGVEKAGELEQLIADWVVKNFKPTFWRAVNPQPHRRSDYPDLLQLPPLELP